jgi:hypothetical protein
MIYGQATGAAQPIYIYTWSRLQDHVLRENFPQDHVYVFRIMSNVRLDMILTVLFF